MKKLQFALLAAAGVLAALPQAKAAGEQDQVDRATRIVERFASMPEKGIPATILRHAKGVAILSVVKGGFIWSGRVGDGVVVARTERGWSGPSFIRTAGVGFGPQIGAKVTDFVLILNTDEAVRAFARGGNVEIGGSLSAAVGPVGRTAELGALPMAAIYTYSRSQGLFVGASLEGMVISTNRLANAHYYGQSVTARAILNSQVRPPHGATRLRAVL